MKDRKQLVITLWALIIVLSIFFLVTINYINKEGTECLNSPLIYGVNQIGYDVKCSCLKSPDNINFYVNNTDIWNSEELFPII